MTAHLPLVWTNDRIKQLPVGDTLIGSAPAVGVPLFVQPTAPVGVVGAYQWVQTGLGPSGADHTVWIEDGI